MRALSVVPRYAVAVDSLKHSAEGERRLGKHVRKGIIAFNALPPPSLFLEEDKKSALNRCITRKIPFANTPNVHNRT